MRYERFTLPEDSDYYSLYEQRNTPNLGELINSALEAIEDANKARLEGVFRNIDFNSETNLGRTRRAGLFLDQCRCQFRHLILAGRHFPSLLVDGNRIFKQLKPFGNCIP